VRIGIGYSTEERHRIIRCCRHRQMLHQESKLLGERFGAKPSGPARIRRFPKTAVKIALSKSIISATVGEAAGSGSYKSREEPQFQQDASCNDLSLTGGFVISSGSSMKQTPQVSSRGVRCRAQWVWNTNAHSPRIHTVRVLRLISWIQMGQNPYIALPCTNRCGETSSQSIDLRIHSIGKIGN
jgi:hypothetical protein